ncbi:hypothetical protein BDF19DRAFT_449101 [Syncephalis fuscata]|nr:hypothetical protein BDF19DRAFT_449101 [Syncephalis fuscata]
MANTNLLAEKQKEVDSLVQELDAITQLSQSFLQGLNDPTFITPRPTAQTKAELDAVRTMLSQLRAHAKELGHARLEKHNSASDNKSALLGANNSDTQVDEDMKIGLESLGDDSGVSSLINDTFDDKQSTQSIFELSRGKSASVQTLFSWKMAFRQNAHAAANT